MGHSRACKSPWQLSVQFMATFLLILPSRLWNLEIRWCFMVSADNNWTLLSAWLLRECCRVPVPPPARPTLPPLPAPAAVKPPMAPVPQPPPATTVAPAAPVVPAAFPAYSNDSGALAVASEPPKEASVVQKLGSKTQIMHVDDSISMVGPFSVCNVYSAGRWQVL